MKSNDPFYKGASPMEAARDESMLEPFKGSDAVFEEGPSRNEEQRESTMIEALKNDPFFEQTPPLTGQVDQS